MKYTVYTDGGCAKNPGGASACASIIFDENNNRKEIVRSYFSSTNNRMEIMAVIHALEVIERGSTVDLYSDSQYVLKTINGEFSKKKNLDLWARLDKALNGLKVTVHWVRGHSENEFNNECDEMCTKAMKNPTLHDHGYEDTGGYDDTAEYESTQLSLEFSKYNRVDVMMYLIEKMREACDDALAPDLSEVENKELMDRIKVLRWLMDELYVDYILK